MPQRRTLIAVTTGLCLVVLAVVSVRAGDTVSANDTARFLAGMPPSAESPLARLTGDPSWQEHARIFDATFEHVEHDQLAPIRAWSSSNLTAPRPTVFYMFSGPDFLYANAFYPDARTYVLAGLEPVGAIPDVTTLRHSPAPDLARVRNSLRWILHYSYFITRQMGSDLSRGRLNGTLPILYVFLARSGKTIREVTPIMLDQEGALAPDAEAARHVQARGVRIVFAGSDGEPRTLYYFSTNLSNGGADNSKFLGFCETLAPGDSLVKSASYLLHSSGFSKVREFLLGHSAAMVQDDTGIPLSYYDPQKWDLQPFGHYVGPIASFRGRYQLKYSTLFKNSQPIDFGIGYRWRPNQSNLLLASKKPGVSLLEPLFGVSRPSNRD
jgi:hypothetical protein